MIKFILKHKYFLLLICFTTISLLVYEKNLDGLMTVNDVFVLIELLLILFYIVFNVIKFYTNCNIVFSTFFSLCITLISVFSGSLISFFIFENKNNNWIINSLNDNFLVTSSFEEPEPSLLFILIAVLLFILLYSSLVIIAFKFKENLKIQKIR